jgi:hypothetical protein
MTVNFSLLALDQIVNTAAILRHMSGGQFNVPLIIRTSSGAGRQLAAQHSHAFESWYASVPGLKVVSASTIDDARGMIVAALYDVHAMPWAIEAVLADLEADVIVFGGDYLYGPCPRVEPLGIGNRMPPARMKFVGRTGDAICVSLIDMGDRLRMICADVLAVEPVAKMPNLPVAQVMWRPLPDLKTSSEAWIYAGGAHHTVLSFSLTAAHMREFAEMAGIEFVHIGADTKLDSFRNELKIADAAWRIK